MKVRANYYQQCDADFSLDVPAEGFGGWQKADLEISPEHTALVVMHAWDCGTQEDYPGWHRVVEFFNRSGGICRDVFPPLLGGVRKSPLKVIHVIGGGPCEKMKRYPGYQRVAALAGPAAEKPEQIDSDPVLEQLNAFKGEHGFGGITNGRDIARGFANNDFPSQAMPLDSEDIAHTTHELLAVCRVSKINHLIYAGFAINWCLLLSEAGMAQMHKHGVMCSAIRQAVTAVENRESARTEQAKELALWRVALSYGFVFDMDDLLKGLADS